MKECGNRADLYENVRNDLKFFEKGVNFSKNNSI